MNYQTDYKRVAGLGSAHAGTHHWLVHRMSSIALALLTPFFVFCTLSLIGAPRAEVIAAFQSPFRAVVSGLFIALSAHHMMQGLQVVIEDYLHGARAKTLLLIGNRLICGLLGVMGVFFILKLALGMV